MDIFHKCHEQQNSYVLKLKSQIDADRLFVPLIGPIGAHMECNGKPVITWGYNDYLGLANHPSNREIEKNTIAKVASNYPMGSRLLSGNNEAYERLEKEFAAFVKKESCLLFATGYLAAIGTIPAIAQAGDCIILDSEAHACLLDAAKIAVANGAKMRVFKHNDMGSLEQQLNLASRNSNQGILIVCDGIYSMSGDVATLPQIIELKKKYSARLFLDDAHGGGVMGETGGGTATYYNLQSDVDLIMNTFSKAFGASGGSICADPTIVNYLRFNARTNIFSHNLQLVFVNKVLNSLNILKNDPTILQRLHSNTELFQKGMRELGFNIGNTQSPITPLIFKVADPLTQIKKLVNVIFKLRDEYGIFATPVTFPAVSSDMFIIRFTVTANHTVEDIQVTLNALSKLKKERLLLL